MTMDVINRSAFLRVQRQFPEEQPGLNDTLDKMYVDVANGVNARSIGLYPTAKPALTGENWFFNDNTQYQGLRQIFTFSSFGNIEHNINTSNAIFTKCTGFYTDNTNWYGMMFGSDQAIAGNFSFYITSTEIIMLDGGTTPTIESGQIVLEWISAIT